MAKRVLLGSTFTVAGKEHAPGAEVTLTDKQFDAANKLGVKYELLEDTSLQSIAKSAPTASEDVAAPTPPPLPERRPQGGRGGLFRGSRRAKEE